MFLTGTSTSLALLNSYTSLLYPSSLIPVDATMRDNALTATIHVAEIDMVAIFRSRGGEGTGEFYLHRGFAILKRLPGTRRRFISDISANRQENSNAGFMPTQRARVMQSALSGAQTLARSKCVRRQRTRFPFYTSYPRSPGA